MTNITSPSAAVVTPANRSRVSLGTLLAWVAVALALALTFVPLWWVIRTGLSTNREVYANPSSLLPVGFTINNFARVLGFLDIQASQALGGSGQKLNFFLYLRNSFIVATLGMAGTLFFNSLAAYAFARLRFPFREKIFVGFLTALMVPGVATLIPNFILMRDLEWLNTFQGILAPTFLMSPFAVFFLRQFFLGMNHEVEEAARIDGASLFGIFWRIVIPLCAPALTTLAILTFIGTWNDYLWPLLIAKDESVRVLTVALGIFRSQTPQGPPDWTGLMAGAALSATPGIVAFLLLGRRIVNSIQFTGYK